jgi:hypothetical protein
MKKFEVEWHGIDLPRITHVIKADAESDAFDKAMEQYRYPAYPDVYVWVDEEEYKQFSNTHYDPHYIVPKKIQESRPEQPARFDLPYYLVRFVREFPAFPRLRLKLSKKTRAKPDGSVGWYENLGKSSLSDRDILLAQLHELRTIKRCVVCTILIVIVIPIVFGVTR